MKLLLTLITITVILIGSVYSIKNIPVKLSSTYIFFNTYSENCVGSTIYSPSFVFAEGACATLTNELDETNSTSYEFSLSDDGKKVSIIEYSGTSCRGMNGKPLVTLTEGCNYTPNFGNLNPDKEYVSDLSFGLVPSNVTIQSLTVSQYSDSDCQDLQFSIYYPNFFKVSKGQYTEIYNCDINKPTAYYCKSEKCTLEDLEVTCDNQLKSVYCL